MLITLTIWAILLILAFLKYILNKDWIDALIIISIVAVFTLGVTILASAFFSFLNPEIFKPQDRFIKLYALQDNIGVSSTSFLGVGSVENRTFFVYLVAGEYGYEIKKMYADNGYVSVRENNSREAYLIIRKFRLNGIAKWFLWPAREPRYIFEVPKGSITNVYSIDLR